MTSNRQFNTPILFMVYHRPDVTRKVFAEIRRLQPRRLFVAAGAPRDVAGDKELCEKVRKITEQIDWDCDVKRLYEEKNVGGALGCKNALDWFWRQVDEGIVLEDDCLPHPSFFPFAAEMLERYRDNQKVMMVSGANFLNNGTNPKSRGSEPKSSQNGAPSYHFSRYAMSWGWASWKRVWKLYDFEMKTFPTVGRCVVDRALKNNAEREYWYGVFKREYKFSKKNAWDYQFVYSIWSNDGICVTSNTNLISNIGFGEGAANTTNVNHPGARLPTYEMKFPLIHPDKIVVDEAADSALFKRVFQRKMGLKGHVRKATLSYTPKFLLRYVFAISANMKMLIGTFKYGKLYKKYRDLTMIPRNLFELNLAVCERYTKTKGCVVECGVWRGGMSGAIAELLGADRSYHLFDSFEGLPPAGENDGDKAKEWQADKTSAAYFDNCGAEMKYAERAMQISGARNAKLHRGWFADTVPGFKPSEPIALLRLDGDWYDSTMVCLEHLYPLVAKGGLIIIDDYYTWDGCSRAVHDYFSRNKLTDRIRQFRDSKVCYIIKT